MSARGVFESGERGDGLPAAHILGRAVGGRVCHNCGRWDGVEDERGGDGIAVHGSADGRADGIADGIAVGIGGGAVGIGGGAVGIAVGIGGGAVGIGGGAASSAPP